MNWWKEKLAKFGEVDGVDFVPFNFNPTCTPQNQVYQSNTYKELTSEPGVFTPRTFWLPWRMINGLKCYLIETEDEDETTEISARAASRKNIKN